MQNKLKKSYKFAFRTSLYITLCLTLITAILFYYKSHILYLLIFAVLTYLVSFIVIQYRVERFIYRRVKNIYDDLTLLESTSLRQQPITTDMGTLTKEIDKYAKNKKFEILSGYRSPRTNAKLRKASSGVAKRSLHMTGQALDLRMPGYKTYELRKLAVNMQAGGVGYYRGSDFVHMDSGRVRTW